MFTVAVLFLLSVVCLNSSTALRASSVRKLWTNSVRSNVNSRGSVVYNSVFALQGSTGNTVDNIIPTECKAYADSIRSGKQISFKETIDLIDRYYQYLEVLSST